MAFLCQQECFSVLSGILEIIFTQYVSMLLLLCNQTDRLQGRALKFLMKKRKQKTTEEMCQSRVWSEGQKQTTKLLILWGKRVSKETVLTHFLFISWTRWHHDCSVLLTISRWTSQRELKRYDSSF